MNMHISRSALFAQVENNDIAYKFAFEDTIPKHCKCFS